MDIITSDQAAQARRGLENLQGMNLAPEILAAASAKLTGVLTSYEGQRNEVQGSYSSDPDSEPTSLEEGYGGMTAADLQLRRLQGDQASDMTGYSMGTRMAIKDLASDQFRSMNTYGVASIAELDAVRSRAGSAMEISPHEFSQGLTIDGSLTAQKVTTKSGWTSKEAQNYGRNEVRQAVKFLEGIGTNLDVGPGGRLNLHSGNAETDQKQLDEMEWAINYTNTLADKYIPQETKDSSIYGIRKEATQSAILDRMLEGTRYNKPGAEGSYFMFDEKKSLPAPLDLNVPGLIDNRAVGGYVAGQYVSGSEFSEREYQQAVLTGSHSEEYLAAAAPNVMGSLFPKPSGIKYDSPEGTEFYKNRRVAYNQEKEDYQRASDIINAQMTTNQNETDPMNKGRRWSGYAVDPEQVIKNELYNDAAIQGLDQDTQYLTGGESESTRLAGGVFSFGGTAPVGHYAGGGFNLQGNAVEIPRLPGFMEGTNFPKNLKADQPDRDVRQWSPTSSPEQMISDEEQYAIRKDNLAKQAEWIITAGQLNPASSTGSEVGGMYGGGDRISDRNQFVQDGLSGTAFVGPMPIRQGSDAWLQQRKGNITASVIGQSTEDLAIGLANQRLGNEAEFVSSGHVKEGNLYEDKVGKDFMSNYGNKLGLTMKEAFFETNPDLPGFGISPDANLYDEDGNRSLLELKYLASEKSMNKSMKTYEDQLQLQMAVTGVKSAHFYRMNKRTGEHKYDLVRADPERQAELIQRGQNAQELASTLTAEGVDDLKKKLASSGQRQANKEAGPATVMKTEEKAKAAKATVMDLSKASTNLLSSAISEANGTVSGDGSGVTQISKKEFGERLQREENISKLAENAAAIAADKAIVDSVKAKEEKAKAVAPAPMSANPLSAAISEANSSPAFGNGSGVTQISSKEFGKRVVREQSKMDLAENAAGIAADKAIEDAERKSDADKEAAKVTKEASKNLKEFGRTAKQAAGIITELAAVYTQGNKTEMGDIRLAAATGADENNVRGMKFALEQGGVAEEATSGLVSKAGVISKQLANREGVAEFQTRMAKFQSKSNNESVNNMTMLDYNDLQGKSTQEVLSMALDRSKGLDVEGRRDYLAELGMSDMAVAVDRVTGQDMTDATANIKKDERLDTNKGLSRVRQGVQESKEWTSTGISGGETAGLVVGGTAVAAGVAGSATVAGLGYVAAKTGVAAKGAGMAATALTSTAAATGGVATKGAGMAATALTSTAAATGGAILAAGAVGYGVGTVLNKTLIEGTSVGDSIGSGIAHTLAFFGNDEAQASVAAMDAYESSMSPKANSTVPSKDLGVASSQSASSAGTNLNSNVTVNVEVSPEGVSTTVNDNGEEYIDTSTTYSQD